MRSLYEGDVSRWSGHLVRPAHDSPRRRRDAKVINHSDTLTMHTFIDEATARILRRGAPQVGTDTVDSVYGLTVIDSRPKRRSFFA